MLVIFLCVNNKYLVRNHLLVYLTLCVRNLGIVSAFTSK